MAEEKDAVQQAAKDALARHQAHQKRQLVLWLGALAVGAVLGTLFLRAQRLSEATYEAMVCRGFTGVYPRARAAAGLGAAGVLLPLLAAAFDVLLFLWLEGALARWGVFG